MRSDEVEAVLLAEVVEGPHELAGHALGPEVVVELEVEGHRPALVLGQRERLVALGPHLDLVGGDALAGDLDPALLVELAAQLGAVGRRPARPSPR